MDKDILFINCSLINLGIIQCSVAMVNFTFSFRTIILRIVANLMTLTLEHDPRFRRVPINNFQMLCHDHRCDKQENIFKQLELTRNSLRKNQNYCWFLSYLSGCLPVGLLATAP